MSSRILHGRQSLLRIFCGDFDKWHHHELYRVILEQARSSGLAGCTVVRGAEGYGRSSVLHTEVALEGAGERPILIEIVDEPGRIASFLKQIEPMLSGALATEEDVLVHHYSTGGAPQAAQNQEKFMNETQARSLEGAQTLLRIYLGESDKVGHTALHTEILERARKRGLAGGTVVRGIAGFGASSVVHADHLLRLSSDLPIVIELVDTGERAQAFLKEIAPLLQGCLVTEEKVTVRHYSHAPAR